MAPSAAGVPHTGFAVTVPDLASTSAAFARQHDVAAAAADTASAVLAGTAGMAGDDRTLAVWRTRYDAVASITWLAVGATASSMHGIAVLLVDTADAYLAAEHHSTPGAGGGPEHLPRPAGARRLPVGPPPSTGPAPDAPPADLADVWPDGDPPTLRTAGTAWNDLASRLDDAAYRSDSAFRTLLAHNVGSTFSTMAEYWRRRFVPDRFDPLFNAAPRTARIVGQVSRELADLIDQTAATSGTRRSTPHTTRPGRRSSPASRRAGRPWSARSSSASSPPSSWPAATSPWPATTTCRDCTN